MAVIFLVSFLLFSMGSFVYVYAYRGESRFTDFHDYLRRGWLIFAPFNCIFYLFSKKRARDPVLDLTQYPELKVVLDNWKVFRDEGAALRGEGGFNLSGKKGSADEYDVAFQAFYRYGWTKFYLKWCGRNHASAEVACPQSLEILKLAPCITSALFSSLPAGKKLRRHLDPFANTLRFHVGLSTPNDDACFICVDDQVYSWRDGEGILFDSTFLHHVRNDTDQSRMLLMCDVERPMAFPGRLFGKLYKYFMRAFTVPNMAGDRRGFANRAYQAFVPIINVMDASQKLKKTNIIAYRILQKTAVALTLILLVGILWALLTGVSALIN